MSQLFRPGVLIVLSLLLVAAAMCLVLMPDVGQGSPRPLSVPSGSHEIAWLHPATNVTSWERLVQAMKRATQSLSPEHPELQLIVASSSRESIPEVTLKYKGGSLLFRWYKLTSSWSAQAWVESLLTRHPPPLAVLSGSTTELAVKVASQLKAHSTSLAEERRPLLVLTTATATAYTIEQRDVLQNNAIKLEKIYPGRTFRFCFNNRQMARAVSHFIWSQFDLQPDRGPVFALKWEDDAYSRDLYLAYCNEIEDRERDSAFLLARLSMRPFHYQPFAWGSLSAGFRQEVPVPLRIASSVGGTLTSNTHEARTVDLLLQTTAVMKAASTMPQRPLIAMTGQVGPTRRFLRDLARSSPLLARRFVVASGDAISFDHVYRDRRVSWPIQDLPFVLVFFCHRNPVEERAGFVRENEPGSGPRQSSGTESLQLYQDIIEALALSAPGCTSADDLKERLLQLRVVERRLTIEGRGVPLFGEDGQRNDRTGEHVVCVRPLFVEDRSLPESVIEVWQWNVDGGWTKAADPIIADYHGSGARR